MQKKDTKDNNRVKQKENNGSCGVWKKWMWVNAYFWTHNIQKKSKKTYNYVLRCMIVYFFWHVSEIICV